MNEQIDTDTPIIVSLQGGKATVVHYDGTSATVRWGDTFDKATPEPIVVNGIPTKGYIRLELRNSMWVYDGGAVNRTDSMWTKATPSATTKLIEAARAEIADLPLVSILTLRLRDAKAAKDLATRQKDDAFAKANELATAESEAIRKVAELTGPLARELRAVERAAQAVS